MNDESKGLQRIDEPHDFAPGKTLSAELVKERVQLIQRVMRGVMKEGVHYGTIPGCKQPSLYKPGSEVLLVTFGIGTRLKVEDLSTDESIRYRLTVSGIHNASGAVIGEGIGECSSDEEKYRWRKATNSEFEHAPAHRRRIKYGWNNTERKEYEIKQIETEAADVANTVLKMAKKRAQVDMTLTALAASDVFAQDLEDLDPSAFDDDRGGGGGEQKKSGVRKPTAKSDRKDAPKTDAPKTSSSGNGAPVAAPAGDQGLHDLSESMTRVLRSKAEGAKMTIEAVVEHFKRVDPTNINDVLKWLGEKAEQ